MTGQAVSIDHMTKVLSTLSDEQMSGIMAVLSDMQRFNKPERSSKAKAVTGSSVVKRKRTAVRAKPSHKSDTMAPSRPLNSWMAFRAYHSPAFKSCQQKSISSFLTHMWKEDPSKAKWAIIAKAYAMIRSRVSKTDAPLDTYLRSIATMAGIMETDDYMSTMGWLLAFEEGCSVLKRLFVPDLSTIPSAYLATSLTTEQILAHCITTGFVDAAKLENRQVSAPATPMPQTLQPHLTYETVSASSGASVPFPLASIDLEDGSESHIPDLWDERHKALDNALMLANVHSSDAADHMKASLQYHEFSQQQSGYDTILDPFAAESSGFPEFDPTSGARDIAFNVDNLGTYLGSSDEQFSDFDITTFLVNAAFET